jgi:hypothetical protein
MSWRSKEMVPEIQDMTMQSRRRHAGSRARTRVAAESTMEGRESRACSAESTVKAGAGGTGMPTARVSDLRATTEA